MKLLFALLGALACACACPAPAETPDARHDLRKMEIAWQALNVADAVTTLDCLHRDVCHEGNPLLGRHPSDAKLIGVKLASGVGHYLVARHLAERDPHAARIFEIGSIVLQGGVVAANLRFVF